MNFFLVSKTSVISTRVLQAASLVGLMGLSGLTQATPMTVDLSFPSGGALFPAGSKATTIAFDNGVYASGSKRVGAGMFSGTASNGTGGFDESTLYLNAGDVLAYCVDILENLLKQSSTYHVNEVAQDLVVPADNENGIVQRDFGRTLRFLGAANQVSQLGFADKNWLNPSTNWMSAAIQVGIWESLYEDSNKDLSTGGGWFTSTSIGVEGNQFLTDSFALMSSVNAPDAVNSSQVKWLEIDGGQDLLVDPVDVPAPAPLLLLLGGLTLLLRRRA